MEGVWAEEYEEDDLPYYDEAIEVPEPHAKKSKVLDPNDPNQPKEPPKPRIVQNPRPKLDVDRLLTEDRGLPELLRMSSNLTYRPGTEISYMKRTLALQELWAHRLFPKYTFADFLSRCETLGKKRPIKTHIRKTRIGMIAI